MLNDKLLNPKSIAVIGASNNVSTPGGSVLRNLIKHKFKGVLYAVNPKENSVQGIKCYNNAHELPKVDLAIIAIASKYVLETVQVLTQHKNTKGFIIYSAGFSEKDEEGAKLEQEIVKTIKEVNGILLGPNNIGLLNQNYAGVFTLPIPKITSKGVDFISSSGATAVFIIEAAKRTGLTFSSIYSVGNSAQIGVEEIVEHLDETFDKEKSSKVKLLYIESVINPKKLLKHCISLAKKGCKIAAIKAGSSKAGSRAASSHTGALANSDIAVDALFKKAGIIRCYSKSELITVASIFMLPELKGKNIAIITHAGGPAIMLTDTLSKNGLKVPKISNIKSAELLKQLYNGSSVSNPIDFLATGNAEQLGIIIDYCEHEFPEIDAMVVIFGSPGLTNVYDVYNVLHNKIKTCKKPVFSVMPSIVNVKNEIEEFISKGNITFPDEVDFGNALGKIYNCKRPKSIKNSTQNTDINTIRKIINNSNDGYLTPEKVNKILEAVEIPVVQQVICKSKELCIQTANKMGFPLVMKVVGPIHKSDVGGIVLNINSEQNLLNSFNELMQIKNATGILIQPMKKGLELFIGVKKESNFGHLIMCGLGGIYIEVLKDIQINLTPVSKDLALEMIKNLKSYKIIKGIRNQEGIDEIRYANIIEKISTLVTIAPEIIELDLNPLIGNSKEINVVDARIRIEKSVIIQ